MLAKKARQLNLWSEQCLQIWKKIRNVCSKARKPVKTDMRIPMVVDGESTNNCKKNSIALKDHKETLNKFQFQLRKCLFSSVTLILSLNSRDWLKSSWKNLIRPRWLSIKRQMKKCLTLNFMEFSKSNNIWFWSSEACVNATKAHTETLSCILFSNGKRSKKKRIVNRPIIERNQNQI